MVVSGLTVNGSRITPASKFLTCCTSAAWRSALMFLCTMPMPPSWAMAMARRASVTVSIAAETTGRFRRSERVRLLASETSLGRTMECAGTRETSSYVSASAWMRSIGSPGTGGEARHYTAPRQAASGPVRGTTDCARRGVCDHPPSTLACPQWPGGLRLPGLPQPSELPRQQPDCSGQVRQARRHPHDQPGQLLVGQDIQAELRRAFRIERIQAAPRE